jgi:tetratricopeptide (TPR) repeat protein/tRNA A-37 threonylcarbamoyl transferase component Bud32
LADVAERLKSALSGQYDLDREIGRGGMAAVYLATDLRHDRQVAIKVLHPELAASVGTDRFLQEIHTVARLNHPHILPVHDSGEADGLLYYVMPYVEGESLRARLDRKGQLSIEETVRTGAEVADALDYAHRQGVVHRDIKPGNILLSDGHAVLADFGIARAISAARDERMTGVGTSVGTPLYSSPEQTAGDETLDGRADIYSLGCVLYEMLSGDVPLGGANSHSIQARRLSETPTSLTVLRDTIPPALDGAIGRALARVPADRFDTAAEFGGALKSSEVASLEGTSPHSVAARERPVQRTRRWLVWPLVVVLLGAAVGAYWWIGGMFSSTDSNSPSGEVLMEARQLYLQGDVLAEEAYKAPGAAAESLYVEAIERFQAAIDLDPENADAYAGIAAAHSWLGISGLWAREDAYPPLKAAVERAMELDSLSANVREALAMKYWVFDWEWQKSSDQFIRAMELAPEDPNAGQWRINAALIQNDLGHTDSAVVILRAGMRQSADSVYFYPNLVEILANSPRSEEAVEEARFALEKGYGSADRVRSSLARALIELERYDEALEALESLSRPPRTAFAYLYARRGDSNRAVRVFEELRAEVSPYPQYLLGREAMVYAWVGDTDRALSLLEEQADATGFVWRLPSDPAFRPLRDEPRFHRILGSMGLACRYFEGGHECRQR